MNFSVLLDRLNWPTAHSVIGHLMQKLILFHPNIKIYQYLITYIIDFLFTSKWSFELCREWHFHILKTVVVIALQYRLMCYECHFQMKTLLIVFFSSEKSSGFYWLSHNALFARERKREREREREREKEKERVNMIMKVQGITKHFFRKGKQNISSLHKIICSLVSLFLFILWKLLQSEKFLQCLITSVLVSYKLISFLKENINFNKLSIPIKNFFLWDTVFGETILTSFNWFWHQYEVHRLR